MQWINLLEYIKYWNILQNLEEKSPFDLIVYENKNFENNTSLEVTDMNELGLDFSVWWKLLAAAKNYKNILIVIDQLSYIYLQPFIQKAIKEDVNFTILNLGSGISWCLNKQLLDTNDIGTMINYNLDVYEPFDFISFFHYLKSSKKQYIKIPNKELPGNLIKDNESFINYDEKLINLQDYGLTWDEWTIITWAWMLQDAVIAHSILREKEKNFDIFCSTNYNFEITEEFKESIQKTEKLILLIDQEKWNFFEKILKSKLWEKQIMDLEFVCITPKEEIQTIHKENLWHAVEFDWENIAQRILWN